jgi:CheY-like chemotaxis protein
MEDENEEECCLKRILVVDDISFNILAVKLMIKEHFGMDVDEASDGHIAVEMFKKGFEKTCGCPNRAYSLIFMDL